MITNARPNELGEALRLLNEKYEGNIEFSKFERVGNLTHFTLKVRDSNGPGHRLSQSKTSKGNRRRLINACWHAHGYFFEYLFTVNPSVWIRASGRKIDSLGGNWEDWNIGSMVEPLYYSEACDCEE